jgi:hypothetical protein
LATPCGHFGREFALSAGILSGAQVTLSIDLLQVRSADGGQYLVRKISTYPTCQLGDLGTLGFTCLRPLLAFYSEAIRASSPFYRFLCFFNVVDKLLDSAAGKFRKLAVKYDVEPPVLNGTLPSEPIAQFDRSFAGKKYTTARDELRSSLRNVIAHLDPRSAIRPFDLDAENSAAIGAAVLGFAATELLTKAYDFLGVLSIAGCDVEQIAL